MATGEPSGVVTISMFSLTCDNSFSKTTMANAEVPADTFAVRFLTEFVDTIPVPASPSGAAATAPLFKAPDGSSNFAPSSVKRPASSPASLIVGKISRNCHKYCCTDLNALNLSIIAFKSVQQYLWQLRDI